MSKSRVFSPLADAISGISDVPGLQAALDAKSASGHSHAGTDISGGVPTFTNVYSTAAYVITDGTDVDINPANGAHQIWTLTANRTPTATLFAEGARVRLHIADGTGPYAVTWSSIAPTWIGGSPPTLPTSGYAVIDIWKANFVIYAHTIGNVA